MAAGEFTAEQLREQFAYNPETGSLTYKRHTRPSWVGRPAAVDYRRGYARVRVRRKWLLVHRIAWVIQTGAWPAMIDHINGDRADNRWCNLRETTPELNQQNRLGPTSRGKVGLLGVVRRGNRFLAKITTASKKQLVGSFDSPAEAHAAYLSAKAAQHPHAFSRFALPTDSPRLRFQEGSSVHAGGPTPEGL